MEPIVAHLLQELRGNRITRSIADDGINPAERTNGSVAALISNVGINFVRREYFTAEKASTDLGVLQVLGIGKAELMSVVNIVGHLHCGFSFSVSVIYCRYSNARQGSYMKNESMLAFRNKLKLLYLKDVFERNTDIDHGLSHKELKELMQAIGIDINDRTLRDDITALQDYMQDVDMELTDNIKHEEGKEKAHPIRYKISKRLFTPTEVKLLMKSVRGIHSLSNEQTEVLLKKLSTLCSIAEAAQIRNESAVVGGFKAYWHNKKHDVLLENIELIDQAIRENRRIRFKYFWYKVTLEPTYPRDPKYRHVISPLVRVYENGFYYLVGLDEDGCFKHFRLDRMTDVSSRKCLVTTRV